jgi:DNA-binding transcriptional MerR regulator
MQKYNQNTIKVSIVDEYGEEVPVTQYEPFQDGSHREVLPSKAWERNLMVSAPIQMKELWILHQTGYKGTPMDVIMSGLTSSIQHDLLMNWYKLKGVTRPCVRPQNKFSREELETINECRIRGVPYKQIAEKLNGRHTVRAIQEVWCRINPDHTKRVQRKFSREELETIKRLREEGLTYRAIADQVNRQPGAVQAACKGYTKHSLRSMKQKLNAVALRIYAHRFSTLMNWKDGKERQKVVREIVEREKSPSISYPGNLTPCDDCTYKRRGLPRCAFPPVRPLFFFSGFMPPKKNSPLPGAFLLFF